MKQKAFRFFISLTLLFGAVGLSHAQQLNDEGWNKYKSFAKQWYPQDDVALAIAPNGAWYASVSGSVVRAKQEALRRCQYDNPHNPTKAACKIIDVNLDSEKSRGSVVSSNNNDLVWCVREGASAPFQTSRSGCKNTDGLIYSTRAAAESSSVFTKKSPEQWGWCVTESSENVFHTTRAACNEGGQGLFYVQKADAENMKASLKFSETVVSGWCVSANEVWIVSRRNACPREHRFFYTEATAKAVFEEKQINRDKADKRKTSDLDNSIAGTAEIEFWKSIKDSQDKDKFRAYLKRFPDGFYVELAKIEIRNLGGSTDSKSSSVPDLNFGKYHALVIGNNNYANLSPLKTAVNDAKAISSLLELDYGFEVDLLENASRSDILRAVKNLRETVRDQDNILIYYAGHGYLDAAVDEGYWLPVDAERDDPSNWILTDGIVAQIKGMKAKHVMVVADSCFSGTITRAIKIEQRTPEWLSEIVSKKTRVALTSGGLEPVLDSGSGNHSAFANAFISILEENDGVLDGSQLFTQLRPKVMVNSTQTPQYGKIHMAGDDGGDFLFVRQ